jgi:hypothetical protein
LGSWLATAKDHGDQFTEDDWVSLAQELARRCALPADANTYAEKWTEEINDTYTEAYMPEHYLFESDLHDGEDYEDAARRILTNAARCLRNGVPATFTWGELDLVRPMMPAHGVHQSVAVRWVRENYGRDDD